VASVLLVEDDPSVREAVSMALEGDGHRVTTAATGDEAIERWRAHRPELVLLDVMLPGKDGFEVCRAIRAHDQVPIIMLTARGDPIDVVVGLESGADDYVTKPFETRVLLARIKAVLRRQERPASEPVLRFGDLVIDPAGMAVTLRGTDLRLTPTELRLLLELARRPGQVFTRALLLERVWDYSYLGDSRLVDVCVQRLRSKVEDDPSNPTLVQTVRGVGYKLVPPPDAGGG
jgi:two-component system response regulator MtrA